jgi:8-oxo-dGTP diphosphatase
MEETRRPVSQEPASGRQGAGGHTPYGESTTQEPASQGRQAVGVCTLRNESIAGIAIEGGKVFIARRPPGGDLGDKWEFPGGKVEEEETDQEALIREYNEEFSVQVKPGPFLGSVFFEHRGINRILKAYRIYFLERNFIPSEHTEWRWVSPGEIGELDFAPSDLKLLPFLEPYFQ